jgi:hypothetical protein
MTLPVTLDEVLTYMKEEGADDDRRAEVESVLEAEAAAQGRKCRIDDPIQPDLREALFRRVNRTCQLRQLALIVRRGDSENGTPAPMSNDPEIRRLENPHRRLVMG